MNYEQARRYIKTQEFNATIWARDLPNIDQERTLLLGELTQGATLHVWLADKMLHRAVFVDDDSPGHAYRAWECLTAELVWSGSTIFLESSDADFVGLLDAQNLGLRFAVFDEASGKELLVEHNPFSYRIIDKRPGR